MFDVAAALDAVELTAPVRIGQVVIPNVCGTGVDIVATKICEKGAASWQSTSSPWTREPPVPGHPV